MVIALLKEECNYFLYKINVFLKKVCIYDFNAYICNVNKVNFYKNEEFKQHTTHSATTSTDV